MKITKNNQFGRSMVEMLGVLAIIGVLSIGGIAGYSKAMQKYKLNKTIEEIDTIVQNARTLCSGRNDTCGAGLATDNTSDIPVLKKLLIIPDYMWDSNSSGGLTNRFGAAIARIQPTCLSDPKFSCIRIGLSNLPKDICIGLLTASWDNILGINLPWVDFSIPQWAGWDGVHGFPPSMEDVHTACEDLQNNSGIMNFFFML